jgi:hypothetical protein
MMWNGINTTSGTTAKNFNPRHWQFLHHCAHLSHKRYHSSHIADMAVPEHTAEHTTAASDTSSLASIDKEKEAHNNDNTNAAMNLNQPHFEPIAQVPTYQSTLHRIHTTTGPEALDLVNLPSRTLGEDAELNEYTEETVSGQILKEVLSHKSGRIERWELVTWKVNDPENPKNWSKPYKWWCTMMVAITCFVVAFNSAVVTADIEGVAKEFGCSEEVALLSITLFVMGFGVGMWNLLSPSSLIASLIISL